MQNKPYLKHTASYFHCNPTERFAFGPNFAEFGECTHRAIQTLNILNDTSQPIHNNKLSNLLVFGLYVC